MEFNTLPDLLNIYTGFRIIEIVFYCGGNTESKNIQKSYKIVIILYEIYLTISPRGRMDYESIAHEAVGR